MTTKLFVIANVKQLRTGGSFRILLPFFRISCCVGVLNSAIFNSFHNRVEFGTILEGLRNFWGVGGFEQHKPPSVRHCERDRVTQFGCKGKAVPLQACSGPEGSRKLRFTDFMTTAQDGGKVVSLMHRPPLPLGNAHGTHFC